MITPMDGSGRGRTDLGWLDSRHTFSFGDFHNPERMGFRALRVINEDRVGAGRGFATHGHRDMEILSYVLEGSLAHQDSLGNGQSLGVGEVQAMTAGTGIRHSEFNPSRDEPVHFYQVWLLPERPGLPPAYAQRGFDAAGRIDRWQVIASGRGAAGALPVRTDAEVLLADISAGRTLEYGLDPARHAWVQVVRGRVEIGGASLGPGDGAAISGERGLALRASERAEVMLFDLA